MITSGLTEAELHGLVDGCLEPDRRTDALRRASRSPGERHQIEAWQDQNELLRAAFVGIEREPLPRALNLQVPKLQAIDDPIPASPSLAALKERRQGRSPSALSVQARTAGLVVLALVTGGAATWFVTDVQRMRRATAGAVAHGPLPVTTIPDLEPAGFSFVSATRAAEAPATLVFRYRNGQAEQVVLVVSPDREGSPAPSALAWGTGGARYTLGGTAAPERLRAVADILRGPSPAR